LRSVFLYTALAIGGLFRWEIVADPNPSVKMMWEAYVHGTEKFDYFVTGAIGTFCAYLVQTLRIERLGLTPSTLELTALVALCISVVAGVKRIEGSLGYFWATGQFIKSKDEVKKYRETLIGHEQEFVIDGHQVDRATVEARLQQHVDDCEGTDMEAKRLGSLAGKWYRIRNVAVVVGFVALIGAKLWKAYL
jgi:hypothetical protein